MDKVTNRKVLVIPNSLNNNANSQGMLVLFWIGLMFRAPQLFIITNAFLPIMNIVNPTYGYGTKDELHLVHPTNNDEHVQSC
jgi:hypothetical protein